MRRCSVEAKAPEENNHVSGLASIVKTGASDVSKPPRFNLTLDVKR